MGCELMGTSASPNSRADLFPNLPVSPDQHVSVCSRASGVPRFNFSHFPVQIEKVTLIQALAVGFLGNQCSVIFPFPLWPNWLAKAYLIFLKSPKPPIGNPLDLI